MKTSIIADHFDPMKHLERALDRQNQFWKYLIVTVGGFLGGQILGAVPLLIVAAVKMMQSRNVMQGTSNWLDFKGLGISNNLALLLMLLPFVTSFFLTMILIKGLHKRRLPEVINGTQQIRWGHFFFSFLLWSVIALAEFGIQYAMDPGNYSFRFNPGAFLPLLLISLFILPIQASYEELLFRGYLAQGFGVATRNRWAAILIPGLLFGLGHLANPEIEAYGIWLTLPQYILLGIVFGMISTLDDGIECAMGAHTANNILASTLVTFKSSVLDTDALFTVHRIDMKYDLLIQAGVLALFVALMQQKYKWNFSVLRQRITAADAPGGAGTL